MMASFCHAQEIASYLGPLTGACPFAVARLLRSHGVALRFVHAPQQHYPGSEIEAVDVSPRQDGTAPSARLTTRFFGLTGVTSPLPQEALAALMQVMQDDVGGALAAWIDLVQHRLLQLLHDGVSQAQPSSCLTVTCDDLFSKYFLHFTRDVDGLNKTLQLALWPVLRQPHCTQMEACWALQLLLCRYGLEAPVTLVPMTGRARLQKPWVACRLGLANHALGEQSVLGPYTPAMTAAATFVIGPVQRQWLRRAAKSGQNLTGDVACVLLAVLPKHVVADVLLQVGIDDALPWRLGVADAAECITGVPLLGLGITTTLSGRTQKSWHEVRWPVDDFVRKQKTATASGSCCNHHGSLM